MKLIKFMSIIWLLLYIFDAPIQYIFLSFGGAQILNILKVVVISVIVLCGLIKILYKKQISVPAFYLLLIAFFAIFIGLINKLPIVQLAYGIKTILPLISFYFLVLYFKGDFLFKKGIFRFFIPVIFFGLLADKFITLPWEGLSYTLGDIEYDVSREWETFGVERLSGFQRASYDAAIIITVLISFKMISEKLMPTKSKGWKIYDYALYIISAYSIYLTTFKSAYLFLGCLILFSVFSSGRSSVKKSEKVFFVFLIKFILVGLFVYALVPPVLSYFGIRFYESNTSNNFWYNFFFASYGKRMSNTWPEALELLNLAPFNGILGRGLGGLGTAQQYGEASLYSAGDNIFVYLIVVTGVLSIFIVASLIWYIFKLNFHNQSGYILAFVLLITLIFGATINFVDSPMVMASIGVLIALFFRQKNLEKHSNLSIR